MIVHDAENALHDFDPDSVVDEIELNVFVDGELRRLEIPVPFGYDGRELLQLVMADIEPSSSGSEFAFSNMLEDGRVVVGDADVAGGQMSADAFRDWELRSQDLGEIYAVAFDLDDKGLLSGLQPGLTDHRTGALSVLCLDETIENDLKNAEIVANNGKAAFRAMRETCGASQAALADALGVNPRTVKRWETPGQLEPPSDARRLVESWHADALAGAHWHIRQAEELRDEFHEAYTLVVYRNQDEFDQVLEPLLANAPSYRWQDALEDARAEAFEQHGDDLFLDTSRPYTNFPGTRSYWRANAAAKLAAVLMDARQIPYGFVYPDELLDNLYGEAVWVPRADVKRIELPTGTLVVCGMR